MIVLGKKLGSFKDKETGKVIEYGKVFVISDDTGDEDLDGQACEALTIKPSMIDDFSVGDNIKLSYNKWGKVDSIIVQ